MSTKNKHILLTGGASGIGKVTVELLAKEGASVSFCDINEQAGKAFEAELTEQGLKVKFFKTDVSKLDQLKDFTQLAIDEFGPIQVAINNAGIEHQNKKMTDCDDDLWDKIIDVNLTAVFKAMKIQINHMIENGGGHIINLASVAGLRSTPGLGPYGVSKHGVVSLTKTAAVEFARAGIRVNAVCPSFTNTPMVMREVEKMSDKNKARLLNASPMGRLGEPEEVANLIKWLATDESTFINGQALAVDGGMLA